MLDLFIEYHLLLSILILISHTVSHEASDVIAQVTKQKHLQADNTGTCTEMHYAAANVHPYCVVGSR